MIHLLDSQMRRILCSCLHVHRVRIAGGMPAARNLLQIDFHFVNQKTFELACD